jgi:hypothetical protein
MRPFQVMRFRRRHTLYNSELTPPMSSSFNFTSLPNRRSSVSLFTNEQSQHDKSFLHR